MANFVTNYIEISGAYSDLQAAPRTVGSEFIGQHPCFTDLHLHLNLSRVRRAYEAFNNVPKYYSHEFHTSRWGPPLDHLQVESRLHPRLLYLLVYHEPGAPSAGHVIMRNGRTLSSRCFKFEAQEFHDYSHAFLNAGQGLEGFWEGMTKATPKQDKDASTETTSTKISL